MPDRGKFWWAAASLAAIAAAAGLWLSSRGYGEVSPQGYQYAVALYRACNQRDEAGLARISDMISAALDKNEIRPAEARWLGGIIEKGLSDNWDEASRDVRQLMEDQVRRP